MRRALRTLLTAGFCWLHSTLLHAATPGTETQTQSSIPYVATRHDTVRDLLWLADVSTNDVVYDLGSGDGRVVIAAVRDFHAQRAVGVELNAKLVQESRSNALTAGVADRVQFIQGDLFATDFSAASVLVLYLGQSPNLDLRARILRTLKPGARVVSHGFGMGEWTKDKTLDVRTPHLGMYSEMFNQFRTNPDVPDYDDTGSRASHDTLAEWVVPAPVAGVWRGKVTTESGEQELELVLHQRLSGVTGSFQLQGSTNLAGSLTVDLWGDHLRCWCTATNRPWYPNQMWIDGHVLGERFTGGLRRGVGTNTIETRWTARRDHADFAGNWEWTPDATNAPIQFKIEKHDGVWAATYTDRNREKTAWRDDTKPIPVMDFYDFGGGFYFTLLLGLEGSSQRGSSRRMGPQNGWVVGEALLDHGTLKGSIAFYPYTETFLQRNLDTNLNAAKPSPPKVSQPGLAPGRRDWLLKRMGP